MTTDAFRDPGATERSPAKALAWALAIAALLLVVVVLPAEYGIDWTGAGRLIGLTKMGEAKMAASKAAVAPPPAAPAPPGASATSTGAVPATNSKGALRTDAIEVKLAPGGEVEYKATLAEGESLVYSWDAGGANVEFDFHGEPVAGPADFFVSFEKGMAAKSAGSLRAPFAGTHGWYWKNASTKAVAIQLKLSGFHTDIKRP